MKKLVMRKITVSPPNIHSLIMKVKYRKLERVRRVEYPPPHLQTRMETTYNCMMIPLMLKMGNRRKMLRKERLV
jgi:hypothetical protein